MKKILEKDIKRLPPTLRENLLKNPNIKKFGYDIGLFQINSKCWFERVYYASVNSDIALPYVACNDKVDWNYDIEGYLAKGRIKFAKKQAEWFDIGEEKSESKNISEIVEGLSIPFSVIDKGFFRSFKGKPKTEENDKLINDFASILEKRSLLDWTEFRSKPIQPKYAPSYWIDLFNVFGENTKLIEEENTKSIQEFVTTLKLKPSENEPVFKIDSYEAAHKAHDSFFNGIISEMEKNFPSSIPEEKIIRLPENVQKYVSEIKGKLRLIKSKKSSTRWLERIVLDNSLYVSQNSTKDFIENGMCKTKKYAEQVDWFPKKEKQYRDMNLQEMNSYCFENGYDFHKIVKKGLFNDYRYKKPNDNVLRKFKRIEVK